MLVSEAKIGLGPEDHLALGQLLLKKMQQEGINLRDAVIFPISVGSVPVIGSLLATTEMEAISGAVWMPGAGKPPISSATKTILLVDDVVENGSSRQKQAKEILGFLLKRFKVDKKLKGIKVFAICWLSDSDSRDLTGDVHLLSAAHAPKLPRLVPYTSSWGSKDGTRQMGFADAVKELKWELDHIYKEKHEIVLDKLKTQLWE
jgi:hypothetical protein